MRRIVERGTYLRIHAWLLVLIGAGALCLAVFRLIREPFDWRWLALAGLGLAGNRLLSARLHGIVKEASFPEAFLFLTLLLCGVNAATVVAALIAAGEYGRSTKRWLTLAGNVGIICGPFFVAGSLMNLLFGDQRVLGSQRETFLLYVLALSLIVAAHGLISSFLATFGGALGTGRPVGRAWREGCSQALSRNCSGAVTAGVVTWLMTEFGFHAIVFVAPLLLIHYLVYRPYLEAARLHALEFQRSEARFRSAFEHAAIGMAMVDLSGRWLQVNESLCRILGYSSRELTARSFHLIVLQEDWPAMLQQINLMLEGRIQVFQMKKRYVHKLGYTGWAHWSVSLVRDVEAKTGRLIFQIQDMTEQQRDKGQLLHDSFHDALTGLPNRALFTQYLKVALERAQRKEVGPFAVLLLDLDRFKLINESLGHQFGNQLVVELARRLEVCLRSGDRVSRLGGDEFALLMNNSQDINDATAMAERIRQELAQPFKLSGHEVFTTVSIGIAHSALGYEQPEDMLRDAETAMSRAKSRGAAQHEVFAKEMNANSLGLLQMETDLRRAVERQEFIVHYQPIVTLETGRLRGFEALVRWQHPEQGLVSPAKFIPIAEETGLIVPIGSWVLHEACRQIREWRDRYPDCFPLQMSVNLSGKQFLQPDLIGQIREILDETHLDPSHLKLEITESVVMDNVEVAIEMLRQIRRLGIDLSIDDFGTGYSSLSYLHRFPLNTLKIDRSFVSRMHENNENREIVGTIIMLAKNLGMDVIAEGVETKDQMLRLWEMGGKYGQGYYFSRPVAAAAAGELLASRKQWPLSLPCRVIVEEQEPQYQLTAIG